MYLLLDVVDLCSSQDEPFRHEVGHLRHGQVVLGQELNHLLGIPPGLEVLFELSEDLRLHDEVGGAEPEIATRPMVVSLLVYGDTQLRLTL